MEPHAFENSGGKPRVKTPDEKVGAASPGQQIPPIFLQPEAFSVPIYYQGQRPACSAHAAAWYAGFHSRIAKPGYTPNFSWVDIKENAADKNPSDGATMADIFRTLTETGVDDFNPLGNDVQLTDEQYASPLRVTQAMRTNAARKKMVGTPHYVDNPSFNDLKALIYEQKAVILLVQDGDAWWTDKAGQVTWNPQLILPLQPSKPVSGHFIVAHGYDEPYIFFANSWSRKWGMGGHGYFGENYMPYVKEVGYLA